MDLSTLSNDVRQLRKDLKSHEEWAEGFFKMNADDIVVNKNALKALEKRLIDLEKKQKK
jgi:hypothetical protein